MWGFNKEKGNVDLQKAIAMADQLEDQRKRNPQITNDLIRIYETLLIFQQRMD
jgi:hypothetical protein